VLYDENAAKKLLPIEEVNEANDYELYDDSEDEEQDLDEFWAVVHGYMECLDMEMVPPVLLESRPNCYCSPESESGNLSILGQCKFSGDYYWRCDSEKCNFVQFADIADASPPTAMTRFDFGKYYPLGTSIIDRYTNLDHLMAWCGHVFTKRFLVKLLARNDPPTTFPAGSYEIAPGDEYDGFISYRGSTNAAWLWLTLCAEHNLFFCLVLVVIILPCFIPLLRLVDPCTAPR
jgi:hypothetical protein